MIVYDMEEKERKNGTVKIGLDFYTDLIINKSMTDAKIEALKALVEADRYGLAEQVKRLFGWYEEQGEAENE